MTSIPERQAIVNLIQQASRDGARLARACAEADICLRTYRRWYRDGIVQDDKRPTAVRPVPANKLTATEQEQIVEVCNSPAYSQLPPSQIVPDLLDNCSGGGQGTPAYLTVSRFRWCYLHHVTEVFASRR